MLTVLMLTYTPSLDHERHRVAVGTWESLLENVHYSGPMRWHIADDGSPVAHRRILSALAGSYPRVAQLSETNAERGGYGANYNRATHAIHAEDDDLVLVVEDDWTLRRSLDLDELAHAIASSAGRLESIRLGYLGWTAPLRGELYRPCDRQTFLMLDPDSPEHHVFSGGPRLETVRYERAVGVWPESLAAGATEFSVAYCRAARVGVGWPLDIGLNADIGRPSYFSHDGAIPVKDEPLG